MWTCRLNAEGSCRTLRAPYGFLAATASGAWTASEAAPLCCVAGRSLPESTLVTSSPRSTPFTASWPDCGRHASKYRDRRRCSAALMWPPPRGPYGGPEARGPVEGAGGDEDG